MTTAPTREVFEVPALGPAWQPALRGLETRLEPGVLRPITFDDQAATAGRGPTSSTSTSGTRSCSGPRGILRSALFSVGLAGAPGDRCRGRRTCRSRASPPCPGWSWSGRGGLRLHEEVFLTGIRIRGQAMAEAKVEEVLDQALDAAGPRPGGRGRPARLTWPAVERATARRCAPGC